MQDVDGQQSALGYVAVHPDKRRPELWDAAAALNQGGLLKLKVFFNPAVKLCGLGSGTSVRIAKEYCASTTLGWGGF